MTSMIPQQARKYPSPPRSIRRTDGHSMWFPRLVVLAFGAVAAYVTFRFMMLFMCVTIGTVVDGRVTGNNIINDSKYGPTLQVDIEYSVNNHIYQWQQEVTDAEYPKLKLAKGEKSRPVKVQYISIGFARHAMIAETEHRGRTILSAFWIPALTDLVVIVILFGVGINPRRQRWLFIHGIETSASVMDKAKTDSDNGTTYWANILYEHPLTHEKYTRRVFISDQSTWETIHPDQVVTALYHPRKPKRVAVAEWGPFEIMR